MQVKGHLHKMRSEVTDNQQVNYFLPLDDEEINMNDLMNKAITLRYSGVIHCIACGKITKKSYAQGYCFNCMQTVPQAEECVLRPALCKAHLGIARDMSYAREHCLKPQFVYLANTGDIKVGVTRESQIPTRWVDQGATAAIKLCMTPNRRMAGLIELHLGQHFSDKTNWKKMVTNEVDTSLDMLTFRQKALALLNPEMEQFICSDDHIYRFNYPVLHYPTQPKNTNLDKEASISGVLKGIKGQYLLLDNERVINIRRHTGYLVDLEWE
jgi:hypothetical protein